MKFTGNPFIAQILDFFFSLYIGELLLLDLIFPWFYAGLQCVLEGICLFHSHSFCQWYKIGVSKKKKEKRKKKVELLQGLR